MLTNLCEQWIHRTGQASWLWLFSISLKKVNNNQLYRRTHSGNSVNQMFIKLSCSDSERGDRNLWTPHSLDWRNCQYYFNTTNQSTSSVSNYKLDSIYSANPNSTLCSSTDHFYTAVLVWKTNKTVAEWRYFIWFTDKNLSSLATLKN